MTSPVLIFGSTGFDIFAVSKHFKAQTDGPTQTVQFDHPSQIWLDNAIIEPGDSALISAITMSRQGIDTSLFSMIGADSLGKAIRAIINEENISDNYLYQTSSHSTDMHIHLTSTGADQTTLHYTGAFLSCGKKDVANINLPFSWLHIADIPADKKVLINLLDLAESNGAGVSINPRFVHTYHSNWLVKILCRCNWVFLNRDEASMLLGGYFTIQEAAQKLQLAKISAGVVYDDADGCCVFYKDKFYRAGLYGKTKTLEPSGTEAVFCAAFMASIIQQESIESCITHASAQVNSVKSIVGSRAAILQSPALRKLKITKIKEGI